MRTFDLTPLYRSTIGFDHLFSLLDSFGGADGGWKVDATAFGEHVAHLTMKLGVLG